MEELFIHKTIIEKFITEKEVKSEDILQYRLEDQFENINVDYRNSNFKLIKFKFNEIKEEIYLTQDFRIGKGGIFWDGSCVLLKVVLDFIKSQKKFRYFDNKFLLRLIEENDEADSIEKIEILELGAGLALPSLFFSKFNNFKVYATDIKKIIPLMNTIKDLNFNKDDKKYENLILDELNWDKEEDILKFKNQHKIDNFKIILGSELIYLEEYFDELIKVLKSFCGNFENEKKTAIFLSFKIRLPELTQSFLDKFSVYFNFEYIDEAIVKIYYPNPNKLKIIYAFEK